MGGALYKRSTTVYSMERIVLMSIGMTKMEKYSLTGTQNVKEKNEDLRSEECIPRMHLRLLQFWRTWTTIYQICWRRNEENMKEKK